MLNFISAPFLAEALMLMCMWSLLSTEGARLSAHKPGPALKARAERRARLACALRVCAALATSESAHINRK